MESKEEIFEEFVPFTEEEQREIDNMCADAYYEEQKLRQEDEDAMFDSIIPLTEEEQRDFDNALADAESDDSDNNLSDYEKSYNENRNDYSLEEISKQVEQSAKFHLGKDFTFRPNQKEAIVNTVYNWLTGTNHVICSAPTGSGKSIIALLVAAVLSEYYNKTGYILISDLSLIEQYERDVKRSFDDWAVIKGQQTYHCENNGMPFNMGTCKMKGCKTYADIRKKFPVCSSECQYILEREKAMRSNVLVCTYSFWLIQQNLVKKKLGGLAPFLSRDFTICDEAHKLVSIVQGHFSPRFAGEDINKIHDIMEVGAIDDNNETAEALNAIRVRISRTEDNAEIFKQLKAYVSKMKIVGDAVDTINRDFADKNEKGIKLTKEERQLAYACSFIEDHISGFDDYVRIIEHAGVDNIVKNEQDQSDVTIFNCIDESYLMGKCFHNHCGNRLYMSATIGEPNAFSRDCGFSEETHFDIEIPSTFDFTNSPIFYVMDYKLSYREKETSLPRVVELIEKIIDMYADKRGIIQTGSYQFAKYLKDHISDRVGRRLILYDGSKEKQESLDFFKKCSNKVLVGPSLVEGLSFDDDLSRFQIIMKVPYPSLKDKFVAAKQKVNQEWYSNSTAISILQGVGRGIRNEKDWCVTFVLDGCFTQLLRSSYNMFPQQFLNRIQIIPPAAILNR